MMDTMQGLKRTKYCGEFTAEDIGKEAVACGWVQRARDKGMLVFIDLRDRTGIVQLAFDDRTDAELRAKAQTVRSEFVLMGEGRGPPPRVGQPRPAHRRGRALCQRPAHPREGADPAL